MIFRLICFWNIGHAQQLALRALAAVDEDTVAEGFEGRDDCARRTGRWPRCRGRSA
jgi:hypothetical protein